MNLDQGSMIGRPMLSGSSTSASLAPITFAPIASDHSFEHDQPSARAFVTTTAGRTLISAPATAAAGGIDISLEEITDRSMLHIKGRFVGGEAPNRNGALWTAGDLEMGTASVAHGPLNWLHEPHYIIGTLTDAEFVDPRPATEVAADVEPTVQPHIVTSAAIWRWLWPDEAYVVQQASDSGHLWYSMECVSRTVECAGSNGCGKSLSYAQYMAGAACEHMRERSAIRRFADPVFLGGAVIVPPARPGWAEADARVTKEVARLAESAFEQAGSPDVSASEWEQLMAQIVGWAHLS